MKTSTDIELPPVKAKPGAATKAAAKKKAAAKPTTAAAKKKAANAKKGDDKKTVAKRKRKPIVLPPLDLENIVDPALGPGGGGGMPMPGMRSRGAPLPPPMAGGMPGGAPPMNMPPPMAGGGVEIGPDGLPLSPVPMQGQPMPRRRLV
jgi:hypothetical protein